MTSAVFLCRHLRTLALYRIILTLTSIASSLSCASVSSMPQSARELDFNNPIGGHTAWARWEDSATFRNIPPDNVFEAAKTALAANRFTIMRANPAERMVVGEHGITPYDWNVVAGVYYQDDGGTIVVRVVAQGSRDFGFSGDTTGAPWPQLILASMRSQLGERAKTPPTTDRPPPSAGTQPVSGSGTGFSITAGGFAVTNAHVVSACKNLSARLREGEFASLSVIALDRESDLALLKLITGRTSRHAQFRAGVPIRQGEQIVTYGYPLAGALASQGNLSTGVVSALAGLLDDTREIQISAPVQPGNSGGPVLDSSGYVIGMVTSKLNAIRTAKITGDIPQNVNFAIKASILVNFLDANSVTYESKTTKAEISVADIGDQAKGFTFPIECQR